MTTRNRKVLEKTGVVKSSDSKFEAAVKMSLLETAGRAAVTATVTFAVGMILKKMFETTVKERAAQGNGDVKPSSAAHTPSASYRSPARHAVPKQE